MDFSQNHFEVFNLAVSYDLDMEDLSRRYRKVQARVHPDKFVNATDYERRLSLQWASQVNAAYQTLSSDLSRAIYILEIRGVVIQENPRLPGDFLIEQIERREALDEIPQNSCSLGALAAFREEIDTRIKDYFKEFSESYLTKLGLAEMLIYKLQFFTKLRRQVNEIEERILGY